MTVTFNRELFTTTVFDSGALGPLGMVIHQFSSPGTYIAMIKQGTSLVGSLEFEASEASTNMQLSIDLASTRMGPAADSGCNCTHIAENAKVVSTKGYVLFHASSGTGYSTLVHPKDGKEPRFDSTKLAKGDLYALSLLKPTKYYITNRLGSAKGTIEVTFTVATPRLQTLSAQEIDVSFDHFTPADVKVKATQGIVFRVLDKARITVETPEEKQDKVPVIPRRFVIAHDPTRMK